MLITTIATDTDKKLNVGDPFESSRIREIRRDDHGWFVIETDSYYVMGIPPNRVKYYECRG